MMSKELTISKRITKSAMIQELQAQIIKLSGGGAIMGGEKYLENGDENPNADNNTDGFWLGANGELKVNNGFFKGKIVAEGAFFESSCVFKGIINSEIIEADGETIVTEEKWFYTFEDARNGLMIGDNTYVNVPLGSYVQLNHSQGGRNRYYFDVIDFHNLYDHYIIRIRNPDTGYYLAIGINTVESTPADRGFIYIPGSEGKTLRFKGLPNSPSGLRSGSVYIKHINDADADFLAIVQ